MKWKILFLFFIFGLSLTILYGCMETEIKINETEQINGRNLTPNQTEIICKPQILFNDDFENYSEGSLASDNWQLIKLSEFTSEYGVKKIKENKAMWLKLRGVKKVTDALLIKGKNFDDFSLEFEVHEDKPYDAVPAIVLRFDEGGNYYLVTYNEYGLSLGTVRVYRMPDQELLVENRISVVTLQDGMWHKIKIMANRSKIEGWIDDLIKMFEIEDNKIRKGKVGFANSDGSLGSFYVDNVYVKTLC